MRSVYNLVAVQDDGISSPANAFLPAEAVVPLSQGNFSGVDALVSEGDAVEEGQVIALPRHADDAAVHAPVPGVVSAIRTVPYPDGGSGPAAFVRLDGAFSYLGRAHKSADWTLYSADFLRRILVECGVVNTFAGCSALARDVSGTGRRGHFVAVRLFDDDPSRITERFVSRVYAAQLVQGAVIVARASMAGGIILHVPSDVDEERLRNLLAQYAPPLPSLIVPRSAGRQPAGLRSSMVGAVRALFKSRNPPDAAFAEFDEDSLFIDSVTAYRAYMAAAMSMPVMSSFVHVSGNCLSVSGVLSVRIGVTFRQLALQCGGFRKKPLKVIVNGLVSGVEAESLDVPVSKYVKSLCFVPQSERTDRRVSECTLCGECRAVCPQGLAPDMLYRYASGKYALERGSSFAAVPCIGCGLCNTVCPARLPLCQGILLLRRMNWNDR